MFDVHRVVEARLAARGLGGWPLEPLAVVRLGIYLGRALRWNKLGCRDQSSRAVRFHRGLLLNQAPICNIWAISGLSGAGLLLRLRHAALDVCEPAATRRRMNR